MVAVVRYGCPIQCRAYRTGQFRRLASSVQQVVSTPGPRKNLPTKCLEHRAWTFPEPCLERSI
jgi:hypothetical protein